MATIKLRKWDSAEHLKTDEDIVLYLEACLEEGAISLQSFQESGELFRS